ncbi:MAG: thiamine phosphate synthase [Pseudomonadota bacterium]
MSEMPQLYLITPPAFEPDAFTLQLAGILDALPVACLRLSLAADADTIARAADRVRETSHARDVPLVIERHVALVERIGLDGVHLADTRAIGALRKEMGADPIIGVSAGASRHDGISAGEAGADYIAFGPVGETGLGDGTRAPAELFAWWSEMIELPVVAEGGLDQSLIEALAPCVDFFAIGPEIWSADDPLKALTDLAAPIR